MWQNTTFICLLFSQNSCSMLSDKCIIRKVLYRVYGIPFNIFLKFRSVFINISNNVPTCICHMTKRNILRISRCTKLFRQFTLRYWWHLCRAFNCRILYGLYLPTVILTIIRCPPTHSFTPGLKPSFSANPSLCSPSFLLLKYSLHGFPGLFTVISEHICFLLLVFLFLHFLVVVSVR